MPDGLAGITNKQLTLGKRQGLNIIHAKFTKPIVPTELAVPVVELSYHATRVHT